MISLNLQQPEKRDFPNLNQAGVSLAAGLAALGMGTFTDSNENVNERTAFEVPTYLTCVRILSESVATLPLRVYEKMPRGARPAPDHYLYYLLTERPNPQMTAKVFFSTLMVAAVGWSNAYAKIERDPNSARPIALWPLNPWKTKPVRKDGILVFETTDTTNGQPAIISADDMIHITGFTLNGLQGSPLVHFARQCIGLAMVAARFGARFYANGARNSYFLQADHDLSPEEKTEMRLDVEALSTGANAWRVAALANGVKVIPVEVNENALTEYTTTSKYTRDEIAAFMRVPGYMVGSTEKVLKSTVEAQNREFLSYSLSPWIVGIEQEFRHKLLPQNGRAANQYTLRFYLDALLAADTLTLTAKQTAGRMGGWLSANDIREQLGMEPIPGGDEYIVPLNYQNATEAAEGVETDFSPTDDDASGTDPKNDPQADAVKQAKSLIKQALAPVAARSYLQPLFDDAFSRLQNRTKRDINVVTKTMLPVCEAAGAFFRNEQPKGAAEPKAITKYLDGLALRCDNTTAANEFEKLIKTVVYAVNEDSATALLAQLDGANNE